VVRVRSVLDRPEVARMRSDSEADPGADMAAELAATAAAVADGDEGEYMPAGAMRILHMELQDIPLGQLVRCIDLAGKHPRTQGRSFWGLALRKGIVAPLRQVCFARQAALAVGTDHCEWACVRRNLYC
jgi:hypothetical protein